MKPSNILHKITTQRHRFTLQHGETPRYLILGPGEWEQFRQAVAETGFVHASLLESPQPGPEGWNSGVYYGDMQVVVFERPQVTCRNNLSPAAPAGPP